MNNYKLLIKAVLLMVGLSISLNANSTIEDELQSPANSFPMADQLSNSALENKRDSYLQKRSWALGQNVKLNGDTFYIGWGQSDVQVSPKDVSFSDARVSAFESALLTAKGKFTRFSQSRIASESMQQFFSDERDVGNESSPSTLFQQFSQKVLALGNAELDSMLTKMGVDPSDFSLKRKRDLAKETFQKTVVVNAVSSVSGLRPIVTFEDNNSVGVLVVYSNKLKQQANEIANGKLVPNAQGSEKGKSVGQQLLSKITQDSGYIFQHGIRVMKDEYENIALVSFGQSGVKATATTSKLQLKFALKAAMSTARMLAESQLAEFVNATVTLQDKTTLSGSSSVSEITHGDVVSIEEATNVGKVIDQFVKQNSKVKLSGISTIKTWTANHPESGHLIAGEVLVWSPYLSDLAKTSRQNPVSDLRRNIKVENSMRESVDFESDVSF